MNRSDPSISAVLIAVTWLEVAVLIVAGGGLLIAHDTVVGVWPWRLAPFNLRYLGALYAAALVAATLQAASGRWSPARVVTPMIFVFTLVVSVYSFVHLDRFDPARVEMWIWFVLYIGVCLNAGVHLWLYRDRPAPGTVPSSGPRRALLLQAGLLGSCGASLLIAPDIASRLWPWPIDRFHAHLYSVSFLTPAIGALVLWRSATALDWRALGWTQLAWGSLPVLGLWLADAQVRRVDWSDGATWGWIGLFATIAGMGGWMLWQARRMGENPRESSAEE
ncbi:MAG: hypothetical protein QFE16_11945 [Pseudomonadota bacterium]|nr:hypothetical protein [Pseudomonadota bacterium]